MERRERAEQSNAVEGEERAQQKDRGKERESAESAFVEKRSACLVVVNSMHLCALNYGFDITVEFEPRLRTHKLL